MLYCYINIFFFLLKLRNFELVFEIKFNARFNAASDYNKHNIFVKSLSHEVKAEWNT